MARTYAELNTSLDFNQASVVPELNGRIGDNNREVYFWLKDGNSNFDLTGKSITLFAKDASGVVKTASTINDQTGISTGRFSLIIPKEFYQATGAVQDAYIQIKNGDTIITSIPVSFQVLENTMSVTHTQSQVFIDSVQAQINDFNQRISATSTDLQSTENALKALQVTIGQLNDQYNSDLFAQKAKDNEFKGNNTFDNKIIAPNGLQGKADTAGTADYLNQSIDQTVQSITAKNWSTFNSGLESFSGFKSHGWANFEYVATSGDLDVTGHVKSNKQVSTSVTAPSGLVMNVMRIGNMVQINFTGTITSSIGWWANVNATIPSGYRPTTATIGFYRKGAGNVTAGIQIGTDGVAYNRETGFNVDGAGNDYFSGSMVYLTSDDFPS